jgi:hypothetical protein
MKAVFVAAVLASFTVWAQDARFSKLKDSAEPVGGLGAFLDKFVGECNAVEGGGCMQTVKEFRQKMRGKHLYMMVSEENAGMVQAGASNFEAGEFTANVTPFFPANGYALTQGAPHKTDANGNPILPFIQVKGKIPSDWTESRFGRMFSSREVRVHVVFSPQDVWTLPKRGGGKMAGVKAKIEGILLTAGRTGEELAVWVNR